MHDRVQGVHQFLLTLRGVTSAEEAVRAGDRRDAVREQLLFLKQHLEHL